MIKAQQSSKGYYKYNDEKFYGGAVKDTARPQNEITIDDFKTEDKVKITSSSSARVKAEEKKAESEETNKKNYSAPLDLPKQQGSGTGKFPTWLIIVASVVIVFWEKIFKKRRR